jgi:hypothetical protein
MSYYHGSSRADKAKANSILSWSADVSGSPGAFTPNGGAASVRGGERGGSVYAPSQAGARSEFRGPPPNMNGPPPSMRGPAPSMRGPPNMRDDYAPSQAPARSELGGSRALSRYAPSEVESVVSHRTSRTSRTSRTHKSGGLIAYDDSRSRRDNGSTADALVSSFDAMAITSDRPTATYSSRMTFDTLDGPREILTDSKTYGRAQDRVTMTATIERPASSSYGRSSYAASTAAARNPLLVAAPSTHRDSRSRRGDDDRGSVISSSSRRSERTHRTEVY